MSHSPRPSPTTSNLGRRAFLLGATATGLLVACGSDGDSASSPTDDLDDTADNTADPEFDGVTYTLVQRFPVDVLVPGEVRLPFSLSTGGAEFVTEGPESLSARILDASGGQVGEEISAARRVITPADYYAFRPGIADPGIYSIIVENGPPEGANFQIFEPGQVAVPLPGETLPPFDTPTVDDARGLDPICTREPVCDFHTQTLTQALSTGKPVVYFVGTPAFCQTGSCAPALESLVAVAPEYAGDIEVVHAEVYTDLTATTVAPAVTELGLTFEPTLFMTDASGTILERVDGLWDATELREVIDRALA